RRTSTPLFRTAKTRCSILIFKPWESARLNASKLRRDIRHRASSNLVSTSVFISPNTTQQKEEPNMARDVTRAIEHVERTLAYALDKSSVAPPKKEALKAKPPTIRGWRAPASDHSQYAEPKARAVFREKSNMSKLTLSARAMKVTIAFDAAAICALPLPNGERVELTVSCEGQRYTTNVSAKGLRKARSVIDANGPDAVFVGLQGKLRGHEIVEAGLTAQPKIA